MCLHHEGSMIGVQCQMMIFRGHIRASKGALQILDLIEIIQFYLKIYDLWRHPALWVDVWVDGWADIKSLKIK